jgi:molecular chaperone GrpE
MSGDEQLDSKDEPLEVKVTDRRSGSVGDSSADQRAEDAPQVSGSLKDTTDDRQELQERLEKFEARHQDVLNRLTRAQADLANVKRRAEADALEVARYANQAMALEMLRVRDGFERAFASIPTELRSLTWIDGVALIQAQLQGVLEAVGVTVIRAEVGDPVDIEVHEVVVTDGDEVDTVVAVVQQGYRMHDRVIRPVLVKAGRKVVAEIASVEDLIEQESDANPGGST